MKKMLHSGLAFGCLLICVVVSVSDVRSQGHIREIIKRMDTHYRALQTLRCEVERSIFDKQIGNTDTRKGTLVMIPGKGRNFAMRLDWAVPTEMITVQNGKFEMYAPKTGLAYTGNSNSVSSNDKGGNALSAMNMSAEELRANFSAQEERNAKLKDGTETFHLILTPKTKQSYKTVDLWVDVNGMPRQMMITRLNGDTDTFFLSKVETNVTINRKVFKLDIPPGVKKQVV